MYIKTTTTQNLVTGTRSSYVWNTILEFFVEIFHAVRVFYALTKEPSLIIFMIKLLLN